MASSRTPNQRRHKRQHVRRVQALHYSTKSKDDKAGGDEDQIAPRS